MTAPTTIHLLKPHRHAGRGYPAGAPLTLPQRKAAWLIGIGVATAAKPAHLADMTTSSPAPAPAIADAKPATRRGAKHPAQKETTKETEE